MLPKGIEYVAFAFVVVHLCKPVCCYCDEHENGYVCEVGVCPSLDKVVKVNE